MAEESKTVTGVVEAIVFKSRDTGYTVFEISVDDAPLTVVGEVVDLTEGEEICAVGTYVNHPTYGRQFKAISIEHVLPTGASAISRYLSGGAVKGIGPVLARRIVERFGEDTLLVMENDPERLTQVRGISPQKARSISEEYSRIVGVRAVMALFSAHGIAPAFAIAAWKKWGGNTQQRVNIDPYCLCCEEVGLPFEEADDFAASLGIEYDAVCRICGGILFVMTHNLSNGHACLPYRKLIETTAGMLGVSMEQTEIGIDELKMTGQVICDESDGEEYVYLPEQYAAETYISDRLKLMLSLGVPDRPVEEHEISLLEEELDIKYARLQREALRLAVSSPVMVLTGGPGTGKTTTLNGILELFERRGMTVALAAPTGRAAKRMGDVSNREAKTIHRLLEVDYGSRGGDITFKRTEKNPLNAEVIIIDEMSMVDARLFCSLLKATRMNSRLILIGDPDQLPSVGAGNVLRDLIDSDMVPCIHLTEIFRQAAQSLIVLSAHDIVSGQMPELTRNDSDFFFLQRSTLSETSETVADLCARRLPKAYGFEPMRDIQVIAPGRQGGAGTHELNRRLQEILNPPDPSKSETVMNGMVFREGDKVMQIRNNYDIEWTRPDGEEGLGIFNGDIGTVTMIDRPSRTIGVSFEDRQAFLSFDQLTEMELAYAVTVHKSQGNEFDAVVLALGGPHKKLSYRNLFYTAVTRAKKLLILVGSRQSVAAMVENDRKTLRYTNLKQRMREEL